MKTSLLSLAGFFPAVLIAPLCAQSPGAIVITTPGSATWIEEITPTGTRTIFSIGANSIFQWNDGFSLTPGSELVFDFLGGDSVVNVLGGNGVNFIGGNVTSNGNVSFVSPQADLLVSGNIAAKSVTLTTLNVDPGALLSAGNVTFSGNPASATGLTITGSIRATGGDIVLSGQRVTVTDTATLHAKGSAMIAGGSVVQLDRNSATRKLKATSGDGFVYHLGNTKAGRIEVAAGADFVHKGRLDAPRIFLEVGQNGKILKESGGILVGQVTLNGVIQKGVEGKPHEGDATSSLSPSTLKMPAIKRPDGSTVSASRTVVSNVPVSASADTARDRKSAGGSVASRAKGSSKQPMLQRASFFGMRGGSEPVKADKR
ncbi:hypothetical protein [Luteolibacter sp. Populi]|uniref:hypothetical protein n=1 Tax=Luteolibacter sp. Populi TaxID=3230487 RepID=UPI003467C0A5